MNRFLYLSGVCWLVSGALCPGETEKPNVVFILADDLGIGDVGCYGSDHRRTPHLDKLASGGTRFTQFFTGALCGPSRALIMSGRYAFRNGSTNQDACRRLPLSELHLGRLFKEAGYATSAIGKWGQLPGEPLDVGYDDSLRFNGSGVYWGSGEEARYLRNGKEVELRQGQYMPDLMQEHALAFVRANRAHPFFLYYSLSHVHGEIAPTPDSPSDRGDLYAENILYMDKLVGALIGELDTLGIRGRTLVFFMGDNGTGKGQNDRSTIGGRSLSGMKGSMLECGGLVPAIANCPGMVPPGRVNAGLHDASDLLPTFAGLIGGRLPAGTAFDGQSFAPCLRGGEDPGRPWIYNQLAAMWYVREARWKLNHRGELFDMSGAPFTETLVPPGEDTAASKAARERLAAVLGQLSPASGIPDTGDGTGRHANKDGKKQ
jgi:arylsulfatase A